MAPIHPVRRAFALTAGAALVALPLIALDAAPALAETPGVVATCAQLTVKPNGYAAKGELRIVVDGEVQTDGDEGGWTTFKGSYPGVYTFEPNTAHTYSVQINSFADDSSGRSFEAGTGGDVSVSGTTTPCSPVVVTGAGSNCTSTSSAGSQSVSLEFSGLRRSVTYLSEVLDRNGTVVKHFQFRTAPVVEHRFTGLTAGATYTARVTDQSNPVLSGSAVVRIGDCATTPTVSLRFSACTPGSDRASLTADLSDLVAGRDYRVSASSGSPRERELRATGSTASASFNGMARGSTTTVTVADQDAARSVRVSAAAPTCGTAGGGQAGSGPSTGTTPPKGGSGPSGPGGAPSTGGGTTSPGGSTSGGAAPGGGAAPSGAPAPAPGRGAAPVGGSAEPTTGTIRSGGPAGTGVGPGSGVATGSGSTSSASPTAAAGAAADAAGPGDSGTGTTNGGSSAGGGGLVAATAEQPIDRLPAAVIAVVLALVLALGILLAVLVRRRRAG